MFHKVWFTVYSGMLMEWKRVGKGWLDAQMRVWGKEVNITLSIPLFL